MAIELENEKGKTDSLLKELLPNSVVEQLRLGGTVEPGKGLLLPKDVVIVTNILYRQIYALGEYLQ